MSATVILVIDEQLRSDQRCDRCGAQAWVEISIVDGLSSLLLCGHHYQDHQLKLLGTDAVIADYRHAMSRNLSPAVESAI